MQRSEENNPRHSYWVWLPRKFNYWIINRSPMNFTEFGMHRMLQDRPVAQHQCISCRCLCLFMDHFFSFHSPILYYFIRLWNVQTCLSAWHHVVSCYSANGSIWTDYIYGIEVWTLAWETAKVLPLVPVPYFWVAECALHYHVRTTYKRAFTT